EHGADQYDAAAAGVQVRRRERRDASPRPAGGAGLDERREKVAQDESRDDEHGLKEEQGAAAPSHVDVDRPERGDDGVREDRDDGERVHEPSRSARNILSPVSTRGQAMRRRKWE